MTEPNDKTPLAQNASRRLKSVAWEVAVGIGFLAAFLFGCLVLLGKFIGGARRFGVTDYTYVYLVGSIVVALLEMAHSALLVKNPDRSKRIRDWLTGVTCIWIPVSGAVALRVLPTTLPVWLPAAFLGFLLVVLLLALCFHRDAMRAVFAEKDLPEQYRSGLGMRSLVLEAVPYAALIVTCSVLLFTESDRRARIDAALVDLNQSLDKAKTFVDEAEAKADPADTRSIAALGQVVAKLNDFDDESLTAAQRADWRRLLAATKQQQDRVSERLAQSRAQLDQEIDKLTQKRDALRKGGPIDLNKIYTTTGQKDAKDLYAELKEARKPVFDKWITGEPRIFLVGGQNIAEAVEASRPYLQFVGDDKPPAPTAVARADARHWVGAFLESTGSLPPAYRVLAVERDATKVRIDYESIVRNEMTTDHHAYLAWAPLGKLAPGDYTLELYDRSQKKLTAEKKWKIVKD